MEDYGKVLLVAMPLFLVLIILEKLYGVFKKRDSVPLDDAMSSIFSGISNVTKDVIGLGFVVLSYEFLVGHLRIFDIPNTVLAYVIAFVVIDFYGYWSHRWSHQINFFWNKHAIHHSSEEFNLACALRQPISSFVNLFTFLLVPAALFGVPAQVIAVTLPIHLFLQFWYHTRHISKLGILEYIFVTPSHHRVHHAINKEYLDKNHSQIFIVWDKWFGTFQEELPDVPPVYGITRPANTWNPIKINFQHLKLLMEDAWRASSWKDKLRIWFMPTGWRPDGFEERYPVPKIENPYHFQKYRPALGVKIQYASLTHMLILLLFLTYLFSNLGTFNVADLMIYGVYIF
ncbi:MAG: sterol desaturase family protein, partial [Schleiferiaceae bacterium]|nr:sterol desaturase family protein [Schleiferiaceae bacterium]